MKREVLQNMHDFKYEKHELKNYYLTMTTGDILYKVPL